MISVSLEEENPFYQPEKNDFSYEELVKRINDCENHWNKNIKNQNIILI